MRNSIRAGIGALAAVGALAFAGPGLAAMTPKLVVGTSTQTGAKALTIGARLAQSDDWLGRLQLFVPTGYKIALPSAGAAAGTAAAQAVEMQVGPSNTAKVTGALKGISPTDPAIAQISTSCDNVTHQAAWMVSLQGGDDSWSFPIFADQTTGSETAAGAQKLVVCFGLREPGALNPMSNKLLTLTLNLQGVTAPTAPGDYKWRSLWTPLIANGDQLDQGATVETQSTVHLAGASVLTIAAKKSGKYLILSGKVVVGGEPADGIRVVLKHGATAGMLTSMGRATSTSTGTWKTRTVLKKPMYFQAGATIGEKDLGSTSCTATFGLPCVNATIGGTGLVSRLVHIRS